MGIKSAVGSPDGDGGAFPDQRVESGGIPVRKADAAMASGAADGIGFGAAVDADAGAVQSGPEDADGVIGARGKVVEVIGVLPARKTAHATVAAERKKPQRRQAFRYHSTNLRRESLMATLHPAILPA